MRHCCSRPEVECRVGDGERVGMPGTPCVRVCVPQPPCLSVFQAALPMSRCAAGGAASRHAALQSGQPSAFLLRPAQSWLAQMAGLSQARAA